MCGLAGIIGSTAGIDVDALRQGIASRGTEQTEWVGDGVMLFHSRLPLTGDQPQPIENDRYVMLYVGEVYNYQQLKPGAKSDTEAVFEMWNRHGKDFERYMDGNWCIAMWDKEKKYLKFFTDPVGVNQICYWHDNETLIFASNQMALIKAGVDVQIVPKRLQRNMAWGYTDSINNIGLFQNKNDYLALDSPYYPVNTAFFGFENSITQAINKRWHPYMCVFLSGGIDSGIIAATLKDRTEYIHLINGEEKNVEYLEKEFGLKVWYIDDFDIDDDLISNMVECWEQPFYAFSPNYILCKAASELGYKVVMTGLGPDELYAGYSYKDAAGFKKARSLYGTIKDDRSLLELEFERLKWHHLQKFDKMAGRFTLEGRFPFLDLTVVQQALILRDKNKSLLKQMARKLLPDWYVDQEKTGFAASSDMESWTGKKLEKQPGAQNGTIWADKRRNFYNATLNHLEYVRRKAALYQQLPHAD